MVSPSNNSFISAMRDLYQQTKGVEKTKIQAHLAALDPQERKVLQTALKALGENQDVSPSATASLQAIAKKFSETPSNRQSTGSERIKETAKKIFSSTDKELSELTTSLEKFTQNPQLERLFISSEKEEIAARELSKIVEKWYPKASALRASAQAHIKRIASTLQDILQEAERGNTPQVLSSLRECTGFLDVLDAVYKTPGFAPSKKEKELLHSISSAINSLKSAHPSQIAYLSSELKEDIGQLQALSTEAHVVEAVIDNLEAQLSASRLPKSARAELENDLATLRYLQEVRNSPELGSWEIY